MKRKLLLIALIGMFNGAIGQIQNQQWFQNLKNPNANIQQALEDKNTFLSDTNNATDRERKKIARFETFWRGRLGPDGTISTAAEMLRAASNTRCANSVGGKWESLALTDRLSRSQGTGKFQCVAVEQNNPDVIYAGSEGGGLWKTTNGGKTWSNITDQLGLPALGVQDIAINPKNNQELYIATGHGGYSDALGYGHGVFHSINGGYSWTRVVGNSQHPNVDESLCVAFSPYGVDQVFMNIGNKIYKLQNPGNKHSMSGWKLIHTYNPGVTDGEMLRELKFIKTNDGYFIFAASQDVFSHTGGHVIRAKYTAATNSVSSFDNITPNISPIPNTQITHFSIETTANDLGAIYVHYTNSEMGLIGGVTKEVVHPRILRSTNNGTSYTQVYDTIYKKSNDQYAPFLGYGRTLGKLHISPINKDKQYLSAFQTAIKKGAGLPFTLPNNNRHPDVRDLAIGIENNNEVVIFAHDGGLTRTKDDGITLERIFVGYSTREIYRINTNQSTGTTSVGCLDNGTTKNQRGVWKQMAGGDGGPSITTTNDSIFFFFINGLYVKVAPGIKPNSNPPLYGWWPNILYKTNIGGTFSGYNFNVRYFQSRFDDDIIYMTHKGLIEYNNAQDALSVRQKFLGFSNNIVGIDESYQDKKKLYMISDRTNNTEKLLFKSTDKGLTFQDISSATLLKSAITNGTQLTDIAVMPSNDEHIYLTIGGYKPAGIASPRVLFSSNGGTSFINETHNLPNVPINSVEVDKRTSIIFVGTDLGVYYLDKTHPTKHSTWQCFNNGMPTVIIKDLAINYCTGKLLAGTFGRDLWQNNLPTSNNNRYVITSNEVWDYNHTRPEDVVIANGATLSINNAKIWMEGNKTITVEPGGKLIVNNSTLTHSCPLGLWGGIIVKGNTLASQEPNVVNTPYPAQGIVRLNNSVLEFAREAVRTYDPNTWVNQGGMVYAHNTVFRNNKRSLAFRIYENKTSNGTVTDYRSGFTKCTFKMDDDFPKTEKLGEQHMVTLWRVRGIDFNGCKFINELSTADRIQGIYAHNADVLVYPYCSSGVSPCPQGNEIKSEFKNLFNGIVSTNHLFNYKTVISKSNFENNWLSAIALNGVKNATVVQNKIKLKPTSHVKFPMGIWIGKCSQYDISENQMIGEKTAPNRITIGLYVQESGVEDNLIYKNQFKDLMISNAAYGNNSDPQKPEKGLKYRCNVHNNSLAIDLSIQPVGNGIAKYQGSLNQLPYNTFTPSATYHIQNLDKSNTSTIYKASSNTNTYQFVPTNLSGSVIVSTALSSPGTPQCISELSYFIEKLRGRIASNQKLSVLKSNFEQARINYLNTKYIYGLTIDNGNTAGLISQIESSVSSQMWQLRTNLINSSPLSDDVILTTINENALNNVLLYEVLFKNPNALRNQEIIQKLQSKKVPMPSYMLNILLGKSEEISTKDQLLMKMSSYNLEASKYGQYVVRHYSADTVYNEQDSLLNWLDKISTLEARHRKAGILLQKANYIGAQQVLDGVNTSLLTKIEQKEHAEFVNFAAFYKSKALSGTSNLLSENTKNELIQRVQNETLNQQTFSKNWLRFINKDAYYEELNIVYGSNKRSSGNKWKVSSKKFDGVTIHPNPAKEYVNIQFSLEETDYQFELIDNQGRVIKSITLNGPIGSESIGLKGLSTGIYHYRILWKQQPVTSGSISVIE